MIRRYWRALNGAVSGARAKTDLDSLFPLTRRCSFDTMGKAHRRFAGLMRSAGLERVQVLKLPADGKSSSGGWVMPRAWDARKASLDLVSPHQENLAPSPEAMGLPKRLAEYPAVPQSLMMWSAPTRKAGVVADVVAVPADPGRWRGRLAGRILLVDRLDQTGFRIAQAAARAGAIGILADHVPLRSVRSPAEAAELRQWFNYTIPFWGPRLRLFGFSLTPTIGGQIRKRLRHGPVRVRAVVRTRLYAGQVPLVTGVVPGRTSDEVLITAHLDEPGASDNLSGCVVGLEILRTIRRLIRAGKMERPRRTLRLICSMEVRGLQYLVNRGWPWGRPIAGINLDMVGMDHAAGRTRLTWGPVLPWTTSFADVLLGDAVALSRPAAKRAGLKVWRTAPGHGGINDNLLVDPRIGAPFNFMYQAPDFQYHSSVDTPDRISSTVLGLNARIAGTWAAAVASAGLPDALRLAARITRPGQLESLRPLVPEAPFVPLPGEVRAHPAWFTGPDRLHPEDQLDAAIAAATDRLRRGSPGRTQRRVGRGTAGLDRLVPLKLFTGYLGWETLSAPDRVRMDRLMGTPTNWGAADWLQHALMLANGKRTLAEIGREVDAGGGRFNWRNGEAIFRILARQRPPLVRFRPVLARSDIVRALRRVGVVPGAMLVAHSSLSRFGYIRGGAHAIIGALQDVVGPGGTLCIPAHSESWIGRPPYDPVQSPSRVGAVSDAFWRMPGVVRSGHPTHSVAAAGPAARWLTTGHIPTRSPMAREGFWGRLVDADGLIALLCPLESNTVMHAAELWAGVPLPPFTVRWLERGRVRTGDVPGCPWHTDFSAVYAALRRRKQLRTIRLGEGDLYVMRARHVVAAGSELFRRRPDHMLPRNCRCAFCRHIRARLAP